MPRDCNDGLYCNGAETCNPATGCVAGAAPCGPTAWCEESNHVCTPLGNGDFDSDQPFTCAIWVKLPANDSNGSIVARMEKKDLQTPSVPTADTHPEVNVQGARQPIAPAPYTAKTKALPAPANPS